MFASDPTIFLWAFAGFLIGVGVVVILRLIGDWFQATPRRGKHGDDDDNYYLYPWDD